MTITVPLTGSVEGKSFIQQFQATEYGARHDLSLKHDLPFFFQNRENHEALYREKHDNLNDYMVPSCRWIITSLQAIPHEFHNSQFQVSNFSFRGQKISLRETF